MVRAVPGGSVFLVLVVALEDLSRVTEFEGGSGGGGDLEKEVYADGKIGAVNEAGIGGDNHLPQTRQLVVPAGSR